MFTYTTFLVIDKLELIYEDYCYAKREITSQGYITVYISLKVVCINIF